MEWATPFARLEDATLLELLPCLRPQEIAKASQLARCWLAACRCDALWIPLILKYHQISTCAINLPAWRLFPTCSPVRVKPQAPTWGAILDFKNLHDVVLHLEIYHLVGESWEILIQRQSSCAMAVEEFEDVWTFFDGIDVPLWPDVELSSALLKLSSWFDSDDGSTTDEEEDADGPRVPLLGKLRSRLMLQHQSTGAAITILDSKHSDWDRLQIKDGGESSGIVTADGNLLTMTNMAPRLRLNLIVALDPVESEMVSDEMWHPDTRLHAYLRRAIVTLHSHDYDAGDIRTFLHTLEWNEAGLEPNLGSVPLVLISKWLDVLALTSLALACLAYRRSCSRPELWLPFCKHAGIQDECLVGHDVWHVLCYNSSKSSDGMPSQNRVIESMLNNKTGNIGLEASVSVAERCSSGWKEVFRQKLEENVLGFDWFKSQLGMAGLVYKFELPEGEFRACQHDDPRGKKIWFDMCKQDFNLSHRVRTTVIASSCNRDVILFDAVGFDAEDEGESAGDGCVLVRRMTCQGINHPNRQHEVALFQQLGAYWMPDSRNAPDFDDSIPFADPHPGHTLEPFLQAVEMVLFFPDDEASIDESEELTFVGKGLVV